MPRRSRATSPCGARSSRTLTSRRTIERRPMLPARSITAALPLLMLAAAAQAEPCLPPTPVPDFANAAIKTTDLGHRIYLLEGVGGAVGGNVTVADRDHRVITVDVM